MENNIIHLKITHEGTIIDPATGGVQAGYIPWNESWMDAIQRDNAFRHEHQLSVNGGTERPNICSLWDI